MTPALLALTAVAAYLIGAIPFGYIVARMRGVDIFTAGSGNIGATNVGRVLGRKFGLLVFTLDLLKGAVPTLLAWLLSERMQPELPADTLAVTAGVAAFLGHLFPVYLRFRGGKGVATGAGVVLVLLPVPALAALFAWAVVVSASRYVSLGSLIAAVVLCVLRFALTPAPFDVDHAVLTGFCLFATMIVFARHNANIGRLLKGNENRLKESDTMLTFSKVLHLLALGLWFGMGVFFSFVVAFSLFGSFESVAVDKDRPNWFPIHSSYDRDTPPSEKMPKPLRKEQGTRAAGFAISPMFDWYFILQAGCAGVALVTALGWSRWLGRVHGIRTIVLIAAVVTVAVGWWMEWKVSDLRVDRNEATDRLLVATTPSDQLVAEAERARSTFGAWHGISVLVNLVTLVLVTIALAMAAKLPESSPTPASPPA